jgi:hypothetical protein
LFTLGALVFVLAAMQANFDEREVWDRIEWADDVAASKYAAVRQAERRMAEAE